MKILVLIMASITRINKSMIWVAGALVTAMSFLLFYDVIARHFFSSPTGWAFDLSIWFTGACGLLLGGYALAVGEHVRVDLFYEKFSLKGRCIVDIVGMSFLLCMATALVWLGAEYVIHYYNIGAKSPGGLNMPLWINWLIAPIGGILIGLQGLVKLINDIYTLATGKVIYITEEEK